MACLGFEPGTVGWKLSLKLREKEELHVDLSNLFLQLARVCSKMLDFYKRIFLLSMNDALSTFFV